MGRAAGVSWSTRVKRPATAAVVIALVLAGVVAAPIADADTGTASPSSTTASAQRTRVIVRFGAGADPAAIIQSHGGLVVERLDVLGAIVADVPTVSLTSLGTAPGVLEVAEDAELQLIDAAPAAAPTAADVADGRANPIHFVAEDFDQSRAGRSFETLTVGEVAGVIGADAAHVRGVTGKGVDVAVIDTGIAPVAGIGAVVNGPDLSFESQNPAVRHLDTYGHGTHLAGIISGLAPDSRLVNIKVGQYDGAVDVSQVIAAIAWVIEHKNDNGLNIRVLNLAYGTQNEQHYTIDPLAHAAEVAWHNGIVVVAAAGNGGKQFGRLTNPAVDPYLVAVGASDTNGTDTTVDDTIATFSSRGNAERTVDLVAPGRSIVSARVPGSYVDEMHPEGRVDSTGFRGSGTSQAAAVTSAAAAILLQNRPDLTPDQVKAALTTSAKRLPKAGADQGAGILDVNLALRRLDAVRNADQVWPEATGTGSLEAARGSSHVEMNGVVLEGEIDIMGLSWSGLSWSGLSWSGLSWSGLSWSGLSWSGGSWSGLSWSGLSWSGLSWSGLSWSGLSWSGLSWSGLSWSGLSWSGLSWSGLSWSGVSWSGLSWSESGWT